MGEHVMVMVACDLVGRVASGRWTGGGTLTASVYFREEQAHRNERLAH